MSDNTDRGSDRGRDRAREARKRRIRRRRKLRFIYAVSAFTVIILTVVLVAGLVRTSTQKNTKAKEEKAAEIAAEEEELRARRQAIAEAEQIAVTYDYDGAIAHLQAQKAFDTDSELVNAIARFTAEKSSLEAKDPLTVPHIFYHSLIVDTNRAFDTAKWDPATLGGINAWMTTIEEFDKITQQM